MMNEQNEFKEMIPADQDSGGKQESASDSSVLAKRRVVALRNLFLDPNNYRFIDNPDYKRISPDKYVDAEVQRRTSSFAIGKNADEAKDLVSSFKKNGWLPIELIQVKELGGGKYLVVEGNRRIAALKHLQRRHQEGLDLENLSPDIFEKMPVVLYEDAGDAHHLVVMGLGHISGKKRWPAINQARLLKKLIDEHGWSETEVCDSLGMKRIDIRNSLMALALCDIYIGSEYGDQFSPEKYNLFREIVRNKDISAWLGVSGVQFVPSKQENLNRIFSWISNDIDFDEDEGSGCERISRDPVILKGSDVRELAKLINDEKALRLLDESRRLSEAAFSSDVMVIDRLTDGLERINTSISILFDHAAKLNEKQLGAVQEAMDKLKGVFAARGRHPVLIGGGSSFSPFNHARLCHFKSININRYKALNDFSLKDVSRVNVIVGKNNASKTSILEAIQLLASQNDVNALFDVITRRGKVGANPSPRWICKQLDSEISISGEFDQIPNNLAKVNIVTDTDGSGIEDKAFYVCSIDVNAEYAGESQQSTTHLYERRERDAFYKSCRVLCPVVFSSPFVQQNQEFIVELYSRAVQAGAKEKILNFIKGNLDADLIDIDIVIEKGPGLSPRFIVTHAKFENPMDLAQFGEGLQRVFQIGLLFSYAKGGVVLIDEFENAIHYGALVEFTAFVIKMAKEFDVQVFLTTHSKECLDAFAVHEHEYGQMAYYALRNESNVVVSYRYDGVMFSSLIENTKIDIR